MTSPFGAVAGAVSAHDLHSGMGAQLRFQDAAGQNVDALAGLCVDQHGGVAVAAGYLELITLVEL